MKTFMDYYRERIQPQLHAIDLFLKLETPPYDHDAVRELLCLSLEEYTELLAEEKIDVMDRNGFLLVMQRGSSPICRLFARELKCGMPNRYTVAHVSYIYNLDISVVSEASEKMGIHCFDGPMLHVLFSCIPV